MIAIMMSYVQMTLNNKVFARFTGMAIFIQLNSLHTLAVPVMRKELHVYRFFLRAVDIWNQSQAHCLPDNFNINFSKIKIK